MPTANKPFKNVTHVSVRLVAHLWHIFSTPAAKKSTLSFHISNAHPRPRTSLFWLRSHLFQEIIKLTKCTADRPPSTPKFMVVKFSTISDAIKSGTDKQDGWRNHPWQAWQALSLNELKKCKGVGGSQKFGHKNRQKIYMMNIWSLNFFDTHYPALISIFQAFANSFMPFSN